MSEFVCFSLGLVLFWGNSGGSLTFIGIHGQKGEGGGVEGSMERNNVSVANRQRDAKPING